MNEEKKEINEEEIQELLNKEIEKNKEKIDFKEYRERKEKLMHDFHHVIKEAHNEHYLHMPDIIGACVTVLFCYLSESKLLVSDIESDESNIERGFFG